MRKKTYVWKSKNWIQKKRSPYSKSVSIIGRMNAILRSAKPARLFLYYYPIEVDQKESFHQDVFWALRDSRFEFRAQIIPWARSALPWMGRLSDFGLLIVKGCWSWLEGKEGTNESDWRRFFRHHYSARVVSFRYKVAYWFFCTYWIEAGRRSGIAEYDRGSVEKVCRSTICFFISERISCLLIVCLRWAIDFSRFQLG